MIHIDACKHEENFIKHVKLVHADNMCGNAEYNFCKRKEEKLNNEIGEESSYAEVNTKCKILRKYIYNHSYPNYQTKQQNCSQISLFFFVDLFSQPLPPKLPSYDPMLHHTLLHHFPH